MLGIGFDELAQPRDLDVEAAVEGAVFAPAGQQHQLLARQGLAGMAGERLEHREFAAGERHRLAFAGEGAQGQVEMEVAETDFGRLGTGRPGRLGGWLAPKHRVDPGQQLARIERLGNVVVGAHFETDDAVDVIALGGEHDDRRGVAGTPQAAHDRQAVLARQHQIQNDQVEGLALQQPVHRRRVLREGDLELVLGQISTQQFAKLEVVVDDQEVLAGGAHSAMITTGLRRAPAPFGGLTGCYNGYPGEPPAHAALA